MAVLRLVQLDVPVRALGDGDIAREAARNYPWDFAVNLLELGLLCFGAGFVSSVTVLQLFVSKRTTSPLAIGLVALLAQGGWFPPQLSAASAARYAKYPPERWGAWGAAAGSSGPSNGNVRDCTGHVSDDFAAVVPIRHLGPVKRAEEIPSVPRVRLLHRAQ